MQSRSYPTELYSYRRLSDDSCSLVLHSTVQLTSDDVKFFDENRGHQCLLYVTSVPVGLEVPKIDIDKLKSSMVENKVYEKDISPSERQRRKIWVLCSKKLGKEPSQEEFEKFYMKYMDKIDAHLAEKIAEHDIN